MSTLLLAPSAAAAQALADQAQAWLLAHVPRYAATRWCDPIQHPLDGRWAIAFERRLAPAFDPAVLGEATLGGEFNDVIGWANVIEHTADWDPPEVLA